MAGALWDVSQWDNALWDAVAGGQQVNLSQGSVTPNRSVALVGIALTSGQGLLTANSAGQVALSGQVLTSGIGALGPAWAEPLTGSAVTSALGTVLPVTRADTFSGQQLNFGQGAMAALGRDVTVNLSGVEATFGQGAIQSGGSFLAGMALAVEQGLPVLSLQVALVGQEAVLAQGPLAAGQDADDVLIVSALGQPAAQLSIPLVGSAVTLSTGTLIPTGDASIPLSGAAATAAPGTATSLVQVPLTGQSIQAALQSLGAPGGAALVGSSISVVAGNLFTTNDRDLQLSGQEMQVQAGAIVSSALAFATGQELQLVLQGIGPRAVALTGAGIASALGLMQPPAPQPVAGEAIIVGSQKPVARRKGSGSRVKEDWRKEALEARRNVEDLIEADMQAMLRGEKLEAPEPPPVDSTPSPADPPPRVPEVMTPVKTKAEEEEEDWLLLG